MAPLALSEAQLQPLLTMQYRARCMSYTALYPHARQLIVERTNVPENIPVGHILLHEDEASIHIVDLAIDPAHQSRGFGTATLLTVQQRALDRQKDIRLQVTPHSPAQRLYERLGFITTACDAVVNEMLWSPTQGIREPSHPATKASQPLPESRDDIGAEL